MAVNKDMFHAQTTPSNQLFNTACKVLDSVSKLKERNAELEKDKSIMSVSLMTILVHVANIFCKSIGNDFEKFVCAFSILLLATSVLTTIFIYEKNAELIECIWLESTKIISLKKYDLINSVCFITGTTLTALFFLIKIICI